MTVENAKKGRSTNGSSPQAETQDSWEQSRPDQMNSNDPLAASKHSKNQAEYSRQTIANEILEAAKTVCGELITDTERTLEKAKYLEGEADRKHVEAHEERERAAAIRQEAEDYREALIDETKRQSTEQLERARATAERECAEMRSRASIESEKMLAEAQIMRAAALEELEAQKIYAEAARFQAASQDSLTQARNRLNFSRTSELLKPVSAVQETTSPGPAPDPVKTNVSDPKTDPSGHQTQIDRATAMAVSAIEIEPSPEQSPGHAGEADGSASDPIPALVKLRNMQDAASRAVDAAVAEERKPANLKKRATKSKRTTTKKS